jgi:LPS-assembly lipoprotein
MRLCDFGRVRSVSQALRVAAVIGTAGLTAGCWQPLYGSGTIANSDSVQEKFAAVAVDIRDPTQRNTDSARATVSLRNALQFDLHNGSGKALAPIYRLTATVSVTQNVIELNSSTGFPGNLVEMVTVYYQLIEIATAKTVITDAAYSEVSFDSPGGEQPFARRSGIHAAEDQGVQRAAEMIRNRLASYFVAGT